jgi:hypothetical protein
MDAVTISKDAVTITKQCRGLFLTDVMTFNGCDDDLDAI